MLVNVSMFACSSQILKLQDWFWVSPLACLHILYVNLAGMCNCTVYVSDVYLNLQYSWYPILLLWFFRCCLTTCAQWWRSLMTLWPLKNILRMTIEGPCLTKAICLISTGSYLTRWGQRCWKSSRERAQLWNCERVLDNKFCYSG